MRYSIWLFFELFRALKRPLEFLESLLEAFYGWRGSRKRIGILCGIPVLVVLVAVLAFIAIHVFERVDTKLARLRLKSEELATSGVLEGLAYSQLEFLKESSTDSGPTEIAKADLKSIELLSLRILELRPKDETAKYRLALCQSISGDADSCLSAMTEIAEAAGSSFPAANAWIAARLLNDVNSSNDPSRLEKVVENLSVAATWSSVSPKLLSVYARILAESGRLNDAIPFARTAAARNPEYQLELMRYYQSVGNEDGLKSSRTEVERIFSERVSKGTETPKDRLAIAEAKFLAGDPKAAISVVESGIEKETEENKLVLMRGLSQIHLRLFANSVARSETGVFSADITLLEEAGKADPNNPVIAEVVVRAMSLGLKPTTYLINILEKQIESGIATGETHRMLADRFYASGNIPEAIKNWGLAVSKSPMDAVSRNNLAITLARNDPPDFERALQLIEEAMRLAPNSPDILESYGQILSLAGKYEEAVVKLEEALTIDPNKLASRQTLEQCYRSLQMIELADAQAKIIENLGK